MTLSIKNGGYAFLMRLDLMLSMSLWKEFQLLQILNNLSIRNLIKLILYDNDVKLLNLREVLYRSICDMFEVWDFHYWYLKRIHQDTSRFDTWNDAWNDTWNEYIMMNTSRFIFITLPKKMMIQ